MNEPPVRLCCGERHWNVQCPDGKVMCCICFDRVEVSELIERNGMKQDVCKGCEDRVQ